jgi:ABC-2 type transport system ATP-binding protein
MENVKRGVSVYVNLRFYFKSMSIQVQNLTKIYGSQKAVDDLSFEAKPGEILGFLGPNGAGKSTTMKIVTCFLPQTSGIVKVCGYDTAEQSMDVRKRIGYLPESNPLYYDLYVKEYLEFIARLHQLGNKSNERIEQMIEKTGLTRERKKKIGQLSKGYKQRVGLAQAMLHNPDVLILDEPTSGLDPNQLVEIRGLIKELGKEKTVVFSTHIMQEVQAICDHVIIISKGKKVADETVEKLQSSSSNLQTVKVTFKEIITKEKLTTVRGGIKIIVKDGTSWELQCEGGNDLREDVSNFAKKHDYTILSLTKETFSLEEVFQKLTKN